MKNDSKERLEKQLNDNPELKERFVMQMSDIRDITEATRLKFKPIVESFKATTAPLEGLADSLKDLANLSSPFADIMDSLKGVPSPLADVMDSLPNFEPSQSIAESMELFNMNVKPILDSLPTLEDLEEAALLLNKIKKEYALLRSSEAEFIEHERLFVPKDELGVYDFLDWYLYCYLFDKPFDARKDEELTLYHFNLIHEFKQRYKKRKKWSVEDERKFIKELESSDSDNKENVSDKPDKPKLQMHLSTLDGKLNMKYRDYFDRFKSDLKAFVPGYDKMYIDALALLIYESDVLHKNIVENELKNFKIWQELFCNILGVEVSQYKPVSIKNSKEYKEQVKNTYYYFDL